MNLVSKDDNLEVYTKVGDKLIIGNANIEKIYYFFYKGRFCHISFRFSSSSDYDEIKKTLFHVYGEIEVKKPLNQFSHTFFPTYRWIGEKVILRLDYNKAINDLVQKFYNGNKKKVERYAGELSISYKPIWNEEREEDRQRRIEEGSKDL